jgi:hypothetical protein
MPLWTPARISTALWLDAADSDSITESSGAVSEWADKSGNNRDFAQATPALQPSLTAEGLGGLDVITFNEDYLTSGDSASTWNFLHTSKHGVFAVVQFGFVSDPNAMYSLLGNAGLASANIGFAIYLDDRATFPANNRLGHTIYRGVSGNFVVANLSSNDYFAANVFGLLDVIADPTNGTAANRSETRLFDGTPVKNNGSTNALTISDASYALQIGAAGNNSFPAKMHLAELVIVNAEVTETDRQLIQGYLAWKWGIEGSLPSGHPYENEAPSYEKPKSAYSNLAIWNLLTDVSTDNLAHWIGTFRGDDVNAALWQGRIQGHDSVLSEWLGTIQANLDNAAVWHINGAFAAVNRAPWDSKLVQPFANDASWDSLALGGLSHGTFWDSLSIASIEHDAPFDNLSFGNLSHNTHWNSLATGTAINHAPWDSLSVGVLSHKSEWDSLVLGNLSHGSHWDSLVLGSLSHGSHWDSLSVGNLSHDATWDSFSAISIEHDAPWAGLSEYAIAHNSNWIGRLRDNAALANRAVWASPDASIITVTGETYLIHQGRRIDLGEGTRISSDEGSPVWLADLDILTKSDYSSIQIGDEMTLVFWDTPVSIVCDGRAMARSEDGAPSYSISGISPLALLGETWTGQIALGRAGLASEAVASLVGAIDWQLVDWPLPASAAEIEGTPLEIARTIVSAAGGLIESRIDGSLVARHSYPVSIVDYASQSPEELTDRDLLSHSDKADAAALDNRFVISSGAGESTKEEIQLESIQDEDDAHAHTITAYPWPFRAVSLVHTGDGATAISSLGSAYIDKEELVEIQAGEGSVRYPIASIISTDYQYSDLGAVRSNGKAISTQANGYSLINIRYKTQAHSWRATNARNETIQFLAIE